MIKMSKEDKVYFKEGIKTMSAAEVLVIAAVVDKAPFTPEDKKFCYSQIGQRCERLLRNVASNFRFEDK